MVNRITEHIDIWIAAQMPKTNGAGRGNGAARHSLHGIKKLRELILELAVRGKLVPQDSNDLPASDLLEKIAREKARLIKEGKIKKDKPLPKISEDEKPFELPAGWEWARIGDIGHDWGQKKPENDFTYIEVSAIDSVAGIVKSPITLKSSEAPSRARKIVQVGTVIYSTVRPYLKNICVIEQQYSPEPIASTAFAILHPLQKMPGKFIAAYLKSPVFVKYVESVQTGIAYPAINDKQFFSGVISIPPLAEQHRIVAKVDELMALCDQLEQQQIESSDTRQILVETLLATLANAADQKECASAWQRIANHFDTLFTTEHSIDQLKQTILQLAVMGKLVPQDPNDLPAPRPGKWLEGEIKAGRTRQAGLPAPRLGKWFVYVLECEDGSLYKGHSQDILKRWKQHASGEGSEWTKKHPPKRLVHWEAFNSQEEAVAREKELKSGYGRKWLEREIKAGRTRQAGLPASDLLEKIAKEKARLIKEGKIKKQKPLPEISEDEKPFELPAGWEWVRVWDVAELITSGSRDWAKYYSNEGAKFITMGNLSRGSYELRLEDLRYVIPPSNGEGTRTKLEANDLLISITGDVGNLGRIPENFGEAYINQHTCLLRFMPECRSRYFAELMRSPLAIFQFNAPQRGVKNSFRLGDVGEMIISLPPLAEQQRIVAKVDELMAICDTLKARLNEAQTTQGQLADAIVDQAVA